MSMKNASSGGRQLAYGLLALAVLAGCPFVLPIYWTLILTEIIIMGFFAMSFNLLLGFTGLLSFGQAGFFGMGAYGVGLILTRGGESLLLPWQWGFCVRPLRPC